jgi:hypothetical protein
MKKLLATIIFVLGLHNTGFPQTLQADSVGKELQAYYDKGTPPDWAKALKKLASDEADERNAAASYLTELLEQAQSDQLSGKAPWRQTPYWGSRGENPAHQLRKAIAEELAQANASIESLRVIRWYFDHEKVAPHQAMAVAALEKVAGKEADDYRLFFLGLKLQSRTRDCHTHLLYVSKS